MKGNSIFACFIAGSIVGTMYLALHSPLKFKLEFQPGKTLKYIKETLPLTTMYYSIAIFNNISLTIVALIWDKATLGYYAFAFRISKFV